MFNFKGKTVVITGGSGILGREFVKAFIACGAKVVNIDLDISFCPEGCLAYKADITNKNELINIRSELKDEKGLIPTILINSGAIDAPPNKLSDRGTIIGDIDEKIYDKMMNVNLKGTILCSQIFGEQMKHWHGSIINISSIYGHISPDQRIYGGSVKPISYTASKGAILAITKYMATLYGPHNVRVNCVSFGGVFNNQDPEFVKRYSTKVPLGRMARREEYVGIVLFLASDYSSYMTGSDVLVDGGYLSW